ncbi:MAG: phage integrase [Polaromonas sp.]|nr:phage integrase [Polaromonas sp.]
MRPLSMTAMEPDDFFQHWQRSRLANKELKPMGQAGLKQAELIWRKWLAFCAAHNDMAWEAAQSGDIARFCQSIGARSSRLKTSPVTQRRYWRVLRDLYAHALASGLVALNPAEDAKPPATERVPSLALPMNMWVALRDGLPSGNTFKERRNRLVLLLMMRTALTVAEIVGLTLASVKPCAGSPEEQAALLEYAGLPLLQPEPALWLPPDASPAYLLLVRKARTGAVRALLLDAPTSRALHEWLEVRRMAPGPVTPQSRLILGDRTGKAIAPNGLYNICQAHLAHCLRRGGFLAEATPNTVPDPGGIQHMGPNTLRNTCIALWFNSGVPLEEIQRRCGFKDASVMSRLGAHLASPFPV